MVETLQTDGHRIVAYVDPVPCDWLDCRHIIDDETALDLDGAWAVVIGFGGITPGALHERLELLDHYRGRAASCPAVLHHHAMISERATIEDGAQVMAGAVVQPGAVIRRGAIVNSGAIVEHDAEIGAGAHIAPGAVVLGAAEVGDCALVGAGAVVLPGAALPARTVLAAAERLTGS